MTGLFRIYEHVGEDGYPPEWHAEIKHLVREQAGNRCVRCGHPYEKGEGEWSRCDRNCRHSGPVVIFNPWDLTISRHEDTINDELGGSTSVGEIVLPPGPLAVAQWRILTAHHLNGVKADLRWWNLASLCQRCHLRIQRTVVLPRVFPWEHTGWFKPYAAGWYAHAYLGEELTREETLERLDELLALERVA